MTALSKNQVQKKLRSIFFANFLFLLLVTLFYGQLTSKLIQRNVFNEQYLSDVEVGMIEHYHSQYVLGEISEALAQSHALEAIRSLKFSQSVHHWVIDQSGNLLVHPFTSKQMDSDRNFENIYLSLKYLFELKSSDVFNENIEPEKLHQVNERHTSYTRYFKKWGWIVSTQITIDEPDKYIDTYNKSFIATMFTAAILLNLATMYFTQVLVKELRQQGIRDPLTQLYTRSFLIESMKELELKIARHPKLLLSVLFIDIDDFKIINDVHGHEKGDSIISFVGKIISDSSRPDDICIRYGGDEFVVITVSLHKLSAKLLADRILSSVQKESAAPNVTISVGIAHHAAGEELSNTLVRADESLYKAKSEGKNKIICESTLPSLFQV
ncbi:diguanylate cyclase [Pleionea sp. CnH1-48]|uniref:diguanylate cyclase n=1 Tax=Pleionea sp. CnH1-48 TaxID=2954494 RepID=UPI002097FA22|nr:diguanylate cyclase [Pleionea sp. CnH1-48]MCO7227554.1 diguanylate cyclase [Pleionea sp. CnH1-48]